MRYKFGKPQPKVGNTRIYGKFLLFPKIINKELRWLEYAYYQQEAISIDVGGTMQYGETRVIWVTRKWVDMDGKYGKY
ncbi:hypothetical protein PQE70_gp090 [Bacillus phage vB_BanS_Nate]|uniref:Uncharacterized protein n=1 Tax=Bacillus phage vB_BanS_Nate TaxID=2894788 RepID=A0AAE8YVY2_9CAUD|nr:hypothetical protein PQE70_gp090 [Bacillus phage vB_BanS_Nate]UGO50943.1 hypothetical protein NATE_90 [Bacillus phage vB_BanS_Nate]